MGGEKVLVEAWAIIESPKKHSVSLTSVPMREKDAGEIMVCAVYIKESDADKVLAKTKTTGVIKVPCYVTYRTPNEKPKD